MSLDTPRPGFFVGNLDNLTEIVVPMMPYSTSDLTSRRTVFTIVESGINPVINLVETVDGRVSGPDLRFLGSIASKQKLAEEAFQGISSGFIVAYHHLVVSDIRKDWPMLLSGRVHVEEPVTTGYIRRT